MPVADATSTSNKLLNLRKHKQFKSAMADQSKKRRRSARLGAAVGVSQLEVADTVSLL